MSNTVPRPVAETTRTAGAPQGLLLLVGSCLPVMGAVLITPVLPQLSQEFGATPGSAVLVPMIVAIPALFIAICAPFAGQIVDRAGRKRLLIVALIAYGLLGTAPAWLTTLPSILVSRALVGLCEAAIMTVCSTLIIDYFEGRRRTRYLGLQTVATTIGATLFIVVGGLLGASGWHTPFWVYALGIVLALPIGLLLWEPTVLRSDDPAVSAHERQPVPWRAIGAPLATGVFGGLSFYVLIIEISYLVVGTGVAATDTGVIGAVSAVASLATAAGGLVFARTARHGAGRLLPLAFGTQALGMVIIWAMPTMPGIVVGAIVASFGSGLVLPGLILWMLSFITPQIRGRVIGLATGAFFLGEFFTPIVFGALSAATGDLPAAIGVIGIAAAVVGGAVGLGLRGRVVAAPAGA